MENQISALVTGGAGFIGANLCRRLLADGKRVVCIDNFYSSTESNIADLLQNPDFTFLLHDVMQEFDVPADEIYHLAAPASPVHYQKDPVYTLQTIVVGTVHALQCAQRHGAKLLLSSTSEIYGNPDVHPQKESYHGNVNPNGPRACYDEGKRCAETFCSDYRRSRNVDTKIIRIFNTYGPYMHPKDGRVISEFIIKMLHGEPVTIHGSGQQTRSFCYIDDLIDGIARMMASDFAGPVNLGNPYEITVLQLVEEIARQLGVPVRIRHDEALVDEPNRRRPDISMAKELLDWQPHIALSDGIARTIDYFRERDDRTDGDI